MEIREEDGWLIDANNNRCSIEYFGTRDAAEAALLSLKNCDNCTNCSGCSYCSYCSRCSDVASPIVVGPVRSDGYQFVMGASRSIHAGCRVFISLGAAREHWERTRGGTPLGRETMLILDQLEALASLRS